MEERGKPLPIETLPRKELEKIQNRRLRYTLRKAYETTLFWREKFDSLGIKPDDIKNKEDLYKAWKKGLEITQIDLITKEKFLSPNYLSELYYQPLWSSSFGAPKRVYYTFDDFKRSNEQVHEAINAMGWRKGDKVLSMMAPPPYSSGILSREAFKEYNIRLQEIMIPIPSIYLANIIGWFNPNHLIGLPQKLLRIAHEFEENGISPAIFRITTIGISGESSSKEMKKKLNEIWDAEIFDVWGTTEASTLGFECKSHDGMHITEPRILIDVCNPETKEILCEGEEGNDLITILYQEGEKPGIFLINYSLGDITSIISREKCECGRTLIKLDYPKREDETINIDGRKIWGKSIEKVILSSPDLTGEYFIIEYRDKLTKQILRYDIKLQMQKNKEPQKIKELYDAILHSLIESNPPAYENLLEWYNTNKLNIEVLPFETYENLSRQELPPGKPRRMFRIEKSS